MARVKIREYDAKKLIVENIKNIFLKHTAILVNQNTNLEQLLLQYSWLQEQKLVVKPDQLFGKRKKHNLVLINVTFEEVRQFIQEHINKEITIGKATDKLTHFIIEPFIPHNQEYYLAFTSQRDGDSILFSEQGGIDIEENWNNVLKINIPILLGIDNVNLSTLPNNVTQFVKELYNVFKNLDFSYLEINPFTIVNDQIILLDTVAHIDSCAKFKHHKEWKNLELPDEFGKQITPEEKILQKMDEESGASLKMTVLNPKGRIWTILAGGGASIIYLDMISNLGKGEEIANYGDLAGGPTTLESYVYAKTVLDLMTREKNPKGKILFILGCIANFTDVKKTFKGFIQALEEYQNKIRESNITVFVRRGGPNYEAGLYEITETGKKLDIPMYVHGPETSMNKIIEIAGDHL